MHHSSTSHAMASNTQQIPSLAGSFYGGGERLTVLELMQLKLTRPFLSFLSACETAKGDRSQPDQVVHLAATMLFIGFKSVVGTMWEMWDKDGPFVSQTLYDALCENLDPDIIPYALDASVQFLRESGQPPERWATYIHIGV